MSDEDLMRDYARHRAEASFATLVARHLDLVYSVARRHVGSAALAEEVAQSVFIDLARETERWKSGTPLVAWLHMVSRRTAIDVVRRDARRRQREHQAAEIAAMKTASEQWTSLEPLLDEAVESLDATDRAAVLLRYFENKSLRDVGAALGISDDTAQKRVSRAIEKLRGFFLRRGVAVSAAGLATNLSAHALHVAPTTLGASILSAAVTLPPAATVATTASTLAMTTFQKSIMAAAFVVAAGVALHEARAIRAQGAALLAAHARTETVRAEIREVRVARETTQGQLAAVDREIDARFSALRVASANDAALVAKAREWLEDFHRLKESFAQQPRLNVPELQLLSATDWFTIASAGPLKSADDIRRASSRLRSSAEERTVHVLMQGLRAYLAAHDNQLPNHPRELAPFCPPLLNPAIFDRYEMLRIGPAPADEPERLYQMFSTPGSPYWSADLAKAVMALKEPADLELDSYWTLTASSRSGINALDYNLEVARQNYAKANGGKFTGDDLDLQPYLKWPLSREILQNPLRLNPAP